LRTLPGPRSFPTRRSSDLSGLRVVVTEGRVRVEPARGSTVRLPPVELGAGSVAQSAGEGVLVQQRPLQEVEDVLSWRRGYLVFRDRKSTRLNSSHVKLAYA